MEVEEVEEKPIHNKHNLEDTICAVSTPPGRGGISVVRISGPKALAMVQKIAPFFPGPGKGGESHRVYYGTLLGLEKKSEDNKIVDGDLEERVSSKDKENREPIDEVLLTYFQTGRSFTGDDTVEISCHGSPFITAKILEQLLILGSRLANPGEFTFRAFMNGRIDLPQAESIHSLIQAQTEAGRRQALRHLRGDFSQRVEKMEEEILTLLSHIEANIDFSEEHLEVFSRENMTYKVESICSDIKKIISSYGMGRLIRDGLQIAIVGPPNVGKSSLMNLLCGEPKAIVTPFAGTTRDRIEGDWVVQGIRIRLVDTAGIRSFSPESLAVVKEEVGEKSSCSSSYNSPVYGGIDGSIKPTNSAELIEKIGIERSYEAIKESDLIFYVRDISQPAPFARTVDKYSETDFTNMGLNSSSPVVLIFNKADLIGFPESYRRIEEDWKTLVKEVSPLGVLSISTEVNYREQTVSSLIALLEKNFQSLWEGWEDQAVLIQSRHFGLFHKIKDNMDTAKNLLSEGEGFEIISIEIRQALKGLQEVLGHQYEDDVIDKIFKEFCLGK